MSSQRYPSHYVKVIGSSRVFKQVLCSLGRVSRARKVKKIVLCQLKVALIQDLLLLPCWRDGVSSSNLSLLNVRNIEVNHISRAFILEFLQLSPDKVLVLLELFVLKSRALL